METAFVAIDAHERVARCDVVELFIADVLMATDNAARRYRRHIDEVNVRLKRLRREHAPEDDRPKAIVFPLPLDGRHLFERSEALHTSRRPPSRRTLRSYPKSDEENVPQKPNSQIPKIGKLGGAANFD